MSSESAKNHEEQHTLKHKKQLKQQLSNRYAIDQKTEKTFEKIVNKQQPSIKQKRLNHKAPTATPASQQKKNQSPTTGTYAVIAACLGCAPDRAKVLYSQISQVMGTPDLSKIQNNLANNEGGNTFTGSAVKHLALESISTAALGPLGGLMTSLTAIGTEDAEEDADEKTIEKNASDREKAMAPDENQRSGIIPPFARTSCRR